MTRQLSVLIADDDLLVREGIALILEAAADVTVVSQVGDGAAAVEDAIRFTPDVVLMDLRMPGMDGVEATKRIVNLSLPTPGGGTVAVLVLTTYDTDASVHAALTSGASGFLLKHMLPAELLAAVRVVANGQASLAPSAARVAVDSFRERPPLNPAMIKLLEHLTPREKDVLGLVGRGMSNSEIAAQLFLSEATVKTHFGRILSKLALRDRAQAVVLAYQSGLASLGG